jgi:hypothetical protein
MRGAGMLALLLFDGQPGVDIGEVRTVNDVALFVDEAGSKGLHPLLTDQRRAVSNKRLVESQAFSRIVQIDPVNVKRILQWPYFQFTASSLCAATVTIAGHSDPRTTYRYC